MIRVTLDWGATGFRVCGPGRAQQTLYALRADALKRLTREVNTMVDRSMRGQIAVGPAPLSRRLVTIQGMLLTNANNSREHAMVRSRRVAEQRGQVAMVLQANGVHRLKLPLRVTITRVAPRLAKDTDNLASYGKVVRDEIARMLEVDDADLGFDEEEPPIEWIVTQVKGAQPAVLVLVEEMPAPDGASYRQRRGVPRAKERRRTT